MTAGLGLDRKARNGKGRLATGIIAVVMIILVMGIAILLADEISQYVTDGLVLAITRVIPTALPFMIISDMVIAYARVEDIPFIGGVFGRVLAMPRAGLAPFLIGNICGFPLGGRMCAEMQERGALDKNDAERLLAYSSNPSPSFVVGVVGAGLMGDAMVGVLLLVCLYTATILSAQFFRSKCREIVYSGNSSRQKFILVKSIRSAGEACVAISSFIIIFACIVGIVEGHISIPLLKTVIISVLEVTSAVNYFATSYGTSRCIALSLIAFSLGFGGISVLAQTASFATEAGLSMNSYIKIKLIEGVLSALLAYILFAILGV